MLKALLSLTLLTATTFSLSLLPTHHYWFMHESPAQRGNDNRWDYCDLKCLYLEHYHPKLDFVVLVLTAPMRDTFSACYVKTINGFTLWNKVIKNQFYEEYCGKDEKDWAHMDLFTIKAVYGDGKKQIGEDETYRPK